MGEAEGNDGNMEARALGLMSKYRAQLYVDALGLCRDPVLAESLVLHTIDAVLRNYDEETANVYPLLKTVLKNAYINETRRLVDRATTPVDFAEMSDAAALAVNTTDDEILRNSDNEALRDAIGRLKPEYRRTVVMRYLMEMPLKEIARVVKCPVGTVKWRLSVAKDALAAILRKSLGRAGTWVLLFSGAVLGCVATVAIMRMPSRATDAYPIGGPSYNTPRVREIAAVRAPGPVVVDGLLGEWTPPVFEAACNPPFDRDYTASVRMMWDERTLYVGGDVRTPDPLRNRNGDAKDLVFAGGSVIVRLAADASVGWPLSDATLYDPRYPQPEPLPDDGLVSLVLYHDYVAGVPRLKAHRRMRLQKPLDVPADGWRGAYREHSDGRGYAFEYAIEWSAVGIEPPRPGETRANTWNIHFSDAAGAVCTGQIVENTAAEIPKRLSALLPYSWCYYPPLWGKAVFR